MPLEEITYRDNVRKTLEEILIQTKKTNGRVSKLERWQSYVIGFCAAVMLLIVSFGVPIIVEIVKLQHN